MTAEFVLEFLIDSKLEIYSNYADISYISFFKTVFSVLSLCVNAYEEVIAQFHLCHII